MMPTAPRKLPREGGLNVAPAVEPGTVIAGKYRVEGVLARGGMGLVVSASHEQLGHRVAIKLLLPGLLDETSTRRFLREARALALLKSEHVTRVLDVGELDTGAPFIVMELLEGEDLSALLKREGALPLLKAADYLIQACDAISEAHAQGIVHRDLKPSNLFLTRRRDGSPLVKLLDFGISRPVEPEGDDQVTTTHSSLGTPEFMAPEQFMRTEVDTRADIWSLGVVLYHLLTGQHVFGKNRAPALEIGMGSASPPKIRSVLPEIPREIEKLIIACLQTTREARLGTVAEFVRRLAPFADAETARRYQHLYAGVPSVQPPSSAPSPAPAETEDLTVANVTARTESVSIPKRRSPLLAAMLLIVVLAGSAFAAWRFVLNRPVQPAPVAALPTAPPAPTPTASEPVAPPSAQAPAATSATSSPTRTAAPPRRPAKTKTSEPFDPYGQRR